MFLWKTKLPPVENHLLRAILFHLHRCPPHISPPTICNLVINLKNWIIEKYALWLLYTQVNKDWNRICKDELSYVSYVSLGYSCGGLKMWLFFMEQTSIWVSLTSTCYCRIWVPEIPGNTQSPLFPKRISWQKICLCHGIYPSLRHL